ncbi:MAG: tyrosine-type recombinase/integrase [Candidatus Neomarinimicrobiota bacterium]
MATLVRYPGGARNKGNNNRHGRFYARIYIRGENTEGKSKLIPLKTEDAKVAALRFQKVLQVEETIKAGVGYTFPWMNGSLTTVKRTTLEEAVSDYMSARKLDGLRKKTLEVYTLALQHLIAVVGASRPLEEITSEGLGEFKRAYHETHSTMTVNMNLRALKTYFLWAKENRLIQTVPRIKEIKQSRPLPKYLSNEELYRIQQVATPFLADVFWFYRETGCHFHEPFNALPKGRHLLVPTEFAKAQEECQIPLNPDLLMIYNKLVAESHRPDYYSKAFKKIVTQLGFTDHRFHDLRYTFGVRTWLQTGDIMLVSNLMGHRNIETTMIYTRFLSTRLVEDFPDLAAYVSEYSKGRAKLLGISRLVSD